MDRAVRQYTKARVFVAEYANVEEAVNSVPCTRGSYIRYVCERREHHSTCGGFIWRYVDDDELWPEWCNRRRVRKYSLDNEFICEYDSAVEAARSVNGWDSGIRGCCQGRAKSYKGFIWRYSNGDEVGVVNELKCRFVDMSHEIWKPVSLVDTFLSDGQRAYEVSNFGRLRRPPYVSVQGRSYPEKIYSLTVKENGLQFAYMRAGSGKRIHLGVDYLVATEFLPNPMKLISIRHLDGNMQNSRADNLEWSVVGRLQRQPHRWRTVRQYTLGGLFIGEYSSISEAAAHVHGSGSTIQRVCEAKYGYRTAHGFIWRYSTDDEFDKGDAGVEPVSLDRRKPVRQYTRDGQFVAEFPSVTDAGVSVGKSKSVISAVCRRVMPTAVGYIWRFADDDEFFKG